MPSGGEMLQCEKEEGNLHELYAVAVKKLDLIFGHLPCTISTLYHLYLLRGRIITCTVSGIKKYLDGLHQDLMEA